MTSKPQDTTTTADNKADDAVAPDANRRLLLGAGLVGLAALLAQACSGSNFSSGSKAGSKPTGATGKPDAGDSGDDDDDNKVPTVPTGGGTSKDKDPLIMPVGSTKNAKDLLPGGTKIQGGSSDNPAVATFDPKTGQIKAIGPGDAVITVKTPDGEKKIYVKVKEPTSGGNTNGGTGTAGGNPSGGTAGSTGTPDGGDGTIGGADGGLQNAIDTNAEACFANTVTKLDLSGIADADASMKPRVVCYGSTRSTMVCTKFSGDVPLAELVITKPDGQLLALHGITGADKNASGWRPIVIDNINVGDATSIILVLQLKDKTTKKVTVPLDDTTYLRKFQGKPVLDLSSGSVPNGFIGKQSLASFEAGAGFAEDATAKYPNFGDAPDRLLQTAGPSATWTVNAAVMNPSNKCVYADVMGDVIDINGAAILEYQVFVVYYMDGSAYRTMLHVG